MKRPYTTQELLEKLHKLLGIQPDTAYIANVIMKKKVREQHPLKAAYLARGMWDRKTVDKYFEDLTAEAAAELLKKRDTLISEREQTSDRATRTQLAWQIETLEKAAESLTGKQV